MNEHDKPAFAALMTGIAELYHKKISTHLLTIYWRGLWQFDFEEIKKAMDAHVSNPDVGQFMAKPADIVRWIEGNGEMRALQALSKVESAVRHIGNYSSVAFDDPIIHAVIKDMGGWVAYCSCKGDDIPFQANQFLKRYQSYLQSKLDRYPAYLPGSFERTHHFYGFDVKELPRLVGDAEKAKQIMQSGIKTGLLIHRQEHLSLPQKPAVEKVIQNIMEEFNFDEIK